MAGGVRAGLLVFESVNAGEVRSAFFQRDAITHLSLSQVPGRAMMRVICGGVWRHV